MLCTKSITFKLLVYVKQRLSQLTSKLYLLKRVNVIDNGVSLERRCLVIFFKLTNYSLIYSSVSFMILQIKIELFVLEARILFNT